MPRTPAALPHTLPLLLLALLLGLSTTTVLPAQVAEICDNGIDDDGDGMVDCEDEDCFFPLFSINGYGDSNSSGIALGDVDGDGDLDAWVANRNQPNRIWLNDGVGDLTDSGQALGNSDSSDIALGDVDGDGDLDAWVANNGPNRFWINNGGIQGGTAGNFTDSGQALGGGWSVDVALGDVDGDGDLDAWVTNWNQPNRIWLNDGMGNFTDSGQTLGNSGTYGVALGDVDGDGDLDAWVANGIDQANRVWINDGGLQGGTAGNFSDSGQALGRSFSTSVVLGDLDGDSDLDAWVANGGNQPNRVWINDGLGTFTDSGQVLGVVGNNNSRAVALGDLDGDGDLDVSVASASSQPNHLWLNDGMGNFTDSGLALGNWISIDVALGDVDGDGDLDAWVVNCCDQPNRIWINQGGVQGGVAGHFPDSGGQTLGNSDSFGVAIGDLDGDGDLDGWVVNVNNQPSRVWINNGLGSFADSGQTLGNSTGVDVALGDLDGDGDLDAWVANWSGQPNRVWINQGGDQGGVTGNFTDSGQALSNSNSWGVSLGDVDGDGDLDAWVVNGNNQPNRVWINDGLGNFAESGQALGNSNSFGVSLGDLDGDGDLDAWVVNTSGQPNRVWINQGGDQGGVAGNYSDSGQALGNSNSNDVALGDLDGDGDLDAWVVNTSGQANRVWLNDGLGNFADSGQRLGNSYSLGVSLGDLDGDGDLDALSANTSGQANLVWINQGGVQGGVTGDFADSGQALSNSNSQDVSLGDLDGDGDLDAWVANYSQPDHVFMNLSLCEVIFRRGDANGDGAMDLADGITILGYLFGTSIIDCFDAADANDDGSLNIADAITTLSALFSGGPLPPTPGPDNCDLDPTDDVLGCGSYDGC